ncbi:MAG: hypothetical protein LBV68_01780 [Spirochaetaceae bacterium]|jgi:ribosomal 50S subunit-associated protein YjgA (DUF615 family)|nr:hypothetical protein [Spirochaetaceae bacterium]
MIYNAFKPEIGPDFTIADLNKIRALNYERLQDIPIEEELYELSHRTKKAKKGIATRYDISSKNEAEN